MSSTGCECWRHWPAGCCAAPWASLAPMALSCQSPAHARGQQEGVRGQNRASMWGPRFAWQSLFTYRSRFFGEKRKKKKASTSHSPPSAPVLDKSLERIASVIFLLFYITIFPSLFYSIFFLLYPLVLQ